MQRFNFSLLQTFCSKKCDSILVTSVIEFATFESLLRFLVSILENALERTIHKEMGKFHVI